MAKLFISYRREDAQYQADRLHAAIRPHVADPARDIFIDIDNIPLGVNFASYLDDKVGQCEVLLALIGPAWLEARTATGERRLDDPNDFVRLEIASALKRGIPVVPVLFDGAPVPRADDLPEDLQELALRNGTQIHRASFEEDAIRLVKGLGLIEPPPPPATGAPAPKPASRLPQILMAAVALVLVGLGGFALSQSQFWDAGESDWQPPLEDAGTSPTGPATDTRLGSGDLYDIVDTLERGDPLPDSIVSGKSTAADLEAEDEAAWRAALEAATVTSYRDYLDSGYTRYAGLARAALDDHAEALTRLQRALNAKGFDAGPADGRAGRKTDDAITAFKRAENGTAFSINLETIDDGIINYVASRVEAWQRPAPPPNSSQYRAGDTFRDALSGGGEGPEMVVIPAGSFTMGSPSGEAGRGSDEGPLHEVRIGSAFAVGKYEVTWAEWEACVADGGCSNSGPNGAGGDEGYGKGSRPVINVDWNDARAYASWLSRKTGETYRLLTEAEFEYANRAGTTSAWTWGSNANGGCASANGADQAARRQYSGWTVSTCDDGYVHTAPAGSFSANRFGLHDMTGNVREWTEDCYQDSYAGAPTDGSARQVSNCSLRVLRGGSWADYPQGLRSANHSGGNPTYRGDDIGFRVARTL